MRRPLVPEEPNFSIHLRPVITKGSRSHKLKGSAHRSRELCMAEEISWLKLLVLKLLHLPRGLLEDGPSS